MIVATNAIDLGRALGAKERTLVPTLGALHDGHGALIDAAVDYGAAVVVSIFVNPLQFGPAEDFDRYPRTLDADLELSERHGADVVFAPTLDVVYPDGEPQVTIDGRHYRARSMGMEPKPPQGRRLPIWIGGGSEAALRRVGRLGDGWLASRVTAAEDGRRAIATIHRHAAEAGRDPAAIGLQSMVAPPPRDAEGKRFYAEHARVVARVAELQAMGFQGVALNATAVFQAGARSVDAMIDALAGLHDRLRAEVG